LQLPWPSFDSCIAVIELSVAVENVVKAWLA